MIGARVAWHVRGWRFLTPEEKAQSHGFVIPPPAQVRAYSDGGDLLGSGRGVHYALASTWHPSDEARKGVVHFWNATEESVLVEQDDGAWEQVPVVCIRTIKE